MQKSISLKLFSFIFGVFLMGANAVTIIIPMRLADQGLSYGKIGMAMSMMAFGMLIIKPVIGRHSDVIGAKPYVLFSLLIGAADLYLMSVTSSPKLYIIFNCIFGLCRGMFTSVASSYTVAISDKANLGSSFGNLIGISTLFTCVGGMAAGVLYPFYFGVIALLLIAAVYLISFIIAFKYLPDIKNSSWEKKDRMVTADLWKKMNPHIYLFCFILFLQQFTTGPLWNTFVPLHFYTVFTVSSVFVGILMSMDELIGSPVSFIAGKIADRVSNWKFLSLSYIFAGAAAIFLLFAGTPVYFMIFFLICGCFVTCTQIIIPKSASGFMRSDFKGFEFAVISSFGGLGELLGNMLLGKVIHAFHLNYVVALFAVSYFFVSGIVFAGLKEKRQ